MPPTLASRVLATLKRYLVTDIAGARSVNFTKAALPHHDEFRIAIRNIAVVWKFEVVFEVCSGTTMRNHFGTQTTNASGRPDRCERSEQSPTALTARCQIWDLE